MARGEIKDFILSILADGEVHYESEIVSQMMDSNILLSSYGYTHKNHEHSLGDMNRRIIIEKKVSTSITSLKKHGIISNIGRKSYKLNKT